MLATDGTNTFVLFLYLDDGIEWYFADVANSVVAGISLNGNQYTYTADVSLTANVLNIDKKSNVYIPGLFIFQVDSTIQHPGQFRAYICQ